MNAKLLLLVMLVITTISSLGCGNKNLQPLNEYQVRAARAYRMFETLPESTRNALLAKNLVGMTVFCASDLNSAPSTRVLEVFIRNGAQRASKMDANFVITSASYKSFSGSVKNAVMITDKNDNSFRCDGLDSMSAMRFAQRVADTIGTERKTKILSQARK